MTVTGWLAAIALVQLPLALRVLARFWRTAGGRRIARTAVPEPGRVSVIVPVLNEGTRLGGCLEALMAQPADVIEILVVDGGSSDETRDVAARAAARDARVRVVDASPVPRAWTGKAWGLQRGLEEAQGECVLCLDADVRAAPELARALVAELRGSAAAALSLATCQRLADALDAVVHPSMLATLVYRFGIPGHVAQAPAAVQANGQCFIARRQALRECDAVGAAAASLCEDITIARRLAAAGHAVGFYEGEDLAAAAMHASGRQTWRNWPRSLSLRDQYFGWHGALGLAEVVLVQALPLPAVAAALLTGAPAAVTGVFAALVGVRIGVMAGTARAYVRRPWTYWCSPLADVAVAAALVRSALRRRHVWRGRRYERVAPGRFAACAGDDGIARRCADREVS